MVNAAMSNSSLQVHIGTHNNCAELLGIALSSGNVATGADILNTGCDVVDEDSTVAQAVVVVSIAAIQIGVLNAGIGAIWNG